MCEGDGESSVMCGSDGECSLRAVMSMISMYVLVEVGWGYGQLCEVYRTMGLIWVGNATVECNRMATVGCLNSPRYPKATHN